MHPLNPYKDGIDFRRLAQRCAELKPCLRRGPNNTDIIDWKDEHSMRTLTRAILQSDFGLSIELPEDRLCPPVPNRLNYVLWIRDLVKATREALDVLGDREPGKEVKGLDIGTGASAIYPLLAASLDETWSMVGTEIDPRSASYAESNVARNEDALHGRVRVMRVGEAAGSSDDDVSFFAPLLQHDTPWDFTMCNPPFYASESEIRELADSKDGGADSANAVCTGGEREMVFSPLPPSTAVVLATAPPKSLKRKRKRESSDNTPLAMTVEEPVGDWRAIGGEVTFVGLQIVQSAQTEIRDRCCWFTSMVGKMSSVPTLVGVLRHHGVSNYIVSQLVQGRTRRWVIGWTWGVWRVPDAIGRIADLDREHMLHRVLPPRTTIDARIALPRHCAAPGAASAPPISDDTDTVVRLDLTTRASAGERRGTVVDAVRTVLNALRGGGTEETVFWMSEQPLGRAKFARESPESAGGTTLVLPCLLPTTATAAATFIVKARRAVWTRAARRATKRARVARDPKGGGADKAEAEVVGGATLEWSMVCTVSVIHRTPSDDPDPDASLASFPALGDIPAGADATSGGDVGLRLRWVYGRDAGMFESFASHVGRRVGDLVKEDH